MRTVEQIEKAVMSLSGPELEQFRVWYAEFDQTQWEADLERDAGTGKLDQLADEALDDFDADADLSHRTKLIQSSVKQYEAGESRDGFQALDEIKQKINKQIQS